MGFSAGLYDVLTFNNYAVYGTGGGGTYATPQHVVIDGFEDLDATDERNAIGPAKLRRYDSEMSLLGQRKIDFGFSLACEPDNAVWQVLHEAYLNKTPVEIFAFYKFINDGSGLPDSGSLASRATVLISQFGPPQKLEGIDVNELKLMPSLNPVDPLDVDTPTIVEPEDYTVP